MRRLRQRERADDTNATDGLPHSKIAAEDRLSALLQFLPERNHQFVFLPLLEGKWRGQSEEIIVAVILPRLCASAPESLFDALGDCEEKII
jgi:hypothetical protein